MDPVVGAAGVTAASGLLQALMQQQMQRESDERAERLAKEQAARQALQQAQQNQLGTIQGMGKGEQDALGTLISVLQRTAR